jgi:xanthine dehydrogenase accessory factor
MKGAARIFAFLADRAEAGERVALATLTQVIGSTARGIGTHMGVDERGDFIGSFSGGCIESAIVGEARRILSSGQAEIVRFGAGSPYIDIRLPCGGGIDILVTPDPPAALLREIVDRLEARQPVALALSAGGAIDLVPPAMVDRDGWVGPHFHVRHDPPIRIVIAGHGDEPVALARQALAYGAQVELLTPDAVAADRVRALGAPVTLLKATSRIPPLHFDPHSAMILLFHDHDWEEALLLSALEQPCFFIGAMGSRDTHARRVAMLEGRGVPASLRARIHGPIGLIPASRDPDTLALSVLAELVEAARAIPAPAAGARPNSAAAMAETVDAP